MCSPDLLRKLRALQEQLDTVATIHLNQIWGEVSAVEKIRNRKPTEYLADIGFLNDRLICAHCRCMVREEETAARRGADQCRLQRLHRGAPRLEPARP